MKLELTQKELVTLEGVLGRDILETEKYITLLKSAGIDTNGVIQSFEEQLGISKALLSYVTNFIK